VWFFFGKREWRGRRRFHKLLGATFPKQHWPQYPEMGLNSRAVPLSLGNSVRRRGKNLDTSSKNLKVSRKRSTWSTSDTIRECWSPVVIGRELDVRRNTFSGFWWCQLVDGLSLFCLDIFFWGGFPNCHNVLMLLAFRKEFYVVNLLIIYSFLLLWGYISAVIFLQ